MKVFLFIALFFISSGLVSADTLGQTVLFNTDPQYEYLGRKQASATLRKISDKAYWYISDDYWAGISEPEKNLFLTRLDELTNEFDSRIYPIETQFWGPEPNPGIDNDPRLTILLTRLVDQAGGYFDTSHLYKKSQVPESNEREIIFLNTISLANERSKVFLAHEFQHLIGFYQKDVLRDVSEDTWLNETRAEYAPRLLGYDDIFETSNLRRRIFAFNQNSSEPLGEWKNEASDYGAVTLFGYYLVDNYGEKVLADSLKSRQSGMESVSETLKLNGFPKNFSDIFSDWTIASILNDSSVDPRFAYKSSHLKDFKISPTQSFTIFGFSTSVSLSNSVKDWQPVWYEFNTPVGSGTNLRIDFFGDAASKFRIPYIAFKINGQKEIGYLPIGSTSSPQASGNAGTKFFRDFGSDIYKLILIPANHSKLSDFTKSDPAVNFNLKVQLTAEFEEIVPAPSPSPLASSEISIQNLLAQIEALQNQIAQLRQGIVGQSSPLPAGALSRDLFNGSTGEDVRRLQDFLIDEGVYPQALITGYFGPLTRNAVIKFQQKYGISPQIGYVGVKTRAKIQELNR